MDMTVGLHIELRIGWMGHQIYRAKNRMNGIHCELAYNAYTVRDVPARTVQLLYWGG